MVDGGSESADLGFRRRGRTPAALARRRSAGILSAVLGEHVATGDHVSREAGGGRVVRVGLTSSIVLRSSIVLSSWLYRDHLQRQRVNGPEKLMIHHFY